MNVRHVVAAALAVEGAAGADNFAAALRSLGYHRVGGTPRRGALPLDLEAGALLREAAGAVAPDRELDMRHPWPEPAEAVDASEVPTLDPPPPTAEQMADAIAADEDLQRALQQGGAELETPDAAVAGAVKAPKAKKKKGGEK